MATYFDFKTAGRYYHVIVFKFDIKYSLKSFWKDCRIESKSFPSSIYEDDNIIVEKQSFISAIQYYFGESDYSVSQNGKAPYRYDLFAIQIKAQDIIIIGFPFKSLARNIVQTLIADKKYRTKGNFLKPNLGKVLKETNSESFGKDFVSCSFSGLSMVITGDTNITSINLGGDHPLESTLYKKNFKKMIDENISMPENGIIRCELSGLKDDELPNTRANIHLDNFGNFKLYLHASGKNIFTLPFLMLTLKSLKCLIPTITNPLITLKDEPI
jgi:hypothetical protein